MVDRDILPMTPEPHDDAEMASRLAALYVATPAPDAGQVERCIQAFSIPLRIRQEIIGTR